MKKSVLKKIAILAAPIIWRKLRGKRSRHHWRGGHHGHRRWYHHHGHKRRGIWL